MKCNRSPGAARLAGILGGMQESPRSGRRLLELIWAGCRHLERVEHDVSLHLFWLFLAVFQEMQHSYALSSGGRLCSHGGVSTGGALGGIFSSQPGRHLRLPCMKQTNSTAAVVKDYFWEQPFPSLIFVLFFETPSNNTVPGYQIIPRVAFSAHSSCVTVDVVCACGGLQKIEQTGPILC